MRAHKDKNIGKMTEMENDITVTVYWTIPKICLPNGPCIGICNKHMRTGVMYSKHTVSKPMKTLVQKVRLGHSGNNTYVEGIITYKNLKDNVPDDIISKHIMNIHYTRGKDQLESMPICIDKVISAPVDGEITTNDGSNVGIHDILKIICNMVTHQSYDKQANVAVPDTRSLFRLASSLESIEILDNIKNKLIAENLVLGTKYLYTLIKYVGTNRVKMSPEMLAIMTRLSDILVDKCYIESDEIRMDIGSIIRLLYVAVDNIKIGTLNADDIYDIMFSIGYIRVPKRTLVETIGHLHDYTIIDEYSINKSTCA